MLNSKHVEILCNRTIDGVADAIYCQMLQLAAIVD